MKSLKLSIQSQQYLCLIVFSVLCASLFAQETTTKTGENFEEEFKRHKIAIFTGYSWIPQAEDVDSGEKQTLFVPSIGFSYEYWFSEKWAIGTYDDIELIKYQVEAEDQLTALERENAISLTLGLVYQALSGWTFIAGGGLDIDKNETLPILHLGTEYVILEKNFVELSVSFSYNRKKHYDSFSIGFVLGKKL